MMVRLSDWDRISGPAIGSPHGFPSIKKRFPHRIRYVYHSRDYSKFLEAQAWCRDNIGPDGLRRWPIDQRRHHEAVDLDADWFAFSDSFYFADETIAAAFKIRWV